MADGKNPFDKYLKNLNIGDKEFKYYDLSQLGSQYDRLPYSIKILLESAVRNCDNFQVREQDVQNILNWERNQTIEGGIEIPFKPARVILQKLVKLANPKAKVVIKSENGKVILTPKELDQKIEFQTAVIFCFSFVPSEKKNMNYQDRMDREFFLLNENERLIQELLELKANGPWVEAIHRHQQINANIIELSDILNQYIEYIQLRLSLNNPT